MKTLSQNFLETLPELKPVPLIQPSAALRERIAMLPLGDQVLLQLAIDEQRSQRQIGLLMGCNPGTVSRRVRAIYRRLRDPLCMWSRHG